MVLLVVVLRSLYCCRGTAGHGTAVHGTAGHGTTGSGTAGHGTAGRGTAGHGTAVCGTAGRSTPGRLVVVLLVSRPVVLLLWFCFLLFQSYSCKRVWH